MSAAHPVLGALPRRPPLGPSGGARPGWRPQTRFPPVSAAYSLWRSLQWALVGGALALALGWDRIRGQAGTSSDAVRLREAFERIGGTAIKIGQQLAIRVDLLPFEVCDELARLTDRVPPFPVDHAIASVEAAVGGPLAGVFAAFDPTPVGSASLACVYKARLHSGEVVAVKVQRPMVARQFAADLQTFARFTRLAELLTLVRPGLFAHLRTEVVEMFSEELDFRLEARYQAVYRKYARRDRLSWLTCPRLYPQWTTSTVLVSEFVGGISCADVVTAVETRDLAALARLEAMDIDPVICARRIYWLSAWSRFEAPFFHADPHPANILILPGSRVCMLDFGACGHTSGQTVVLQVELIRRILADDVSGMTETTLALFSPLPHIDLAEVKQITHRHLMRYQRALRDPNAPWHARTTAGLWLYMMEVTQERNIPANLDTLRMVRATLLYDTVAFRLDPALDVEQAGVYLRDAERRIGRRIRRRATSPRPEAGAEAVVRHVERVRSTLSLLTDTRVRLSFAVVELQQLSSLGALIVARGVRALRALAFLSAVGALALQLPQEGWWPVAAPSLTPGDLARLLLWAASLWIGWQGWTLRHRLSDIQGAET